jgi:hypothetical protein
MTYQHRRAPRRLLELLEHGKEYFEAISKEAQALSEMSKLGGFSDDTKECFDEIVNCFYGIDNDAKNVVIFLKDFTGKNTE